MLSRDYYRSCQMHVMIKQLKENRQYFFAAAYQRPWVNPNVCLSGKENAKLASFCSSNFDLLAWSASNSKVVSMVNCIVEISLKSHEKAFYGRK